MTTIATQLHDYELLLIKSTLTDCRGNISLTASTLGISRRGLYNKLRYYAIDTAQYRQPKADKENEDK